MGTAQGWETRRRREHERRNEWHEAVAAAAREDERKVIAEEVRAAGCVCWDLNSSEFSEHLVGWDETAEDRLIRRHDPRCPVALAGAILTQRKET